MNNTTNGPLELITKKLSTALNTSVRVVTSNDKANYWLVEQGPAAQRYMTDAMTYLDLVMVGDAMLRGIEEYQRVTAPRHVNVLSLIR
jgi:hypothetical protein